MRLINFIFILSTCTILYPGKIFAQNMSMPHGQMNGSKNIFLKMMDTMMQKMDNAFLPGTYEADFMAQMIPHHQGAIDMAGYEIKHGRNFGMLQLAKSIVAEQTSEIIQMNLWLKQPFEKPTRSTRDFFDENGQIMAVMMENMPLNDRLNDVDKAFAMVMLPHHQAAIGMAKIFLKFSKDPASISFANQLISWEQIEIEQMNSFISIKL